MQDEGGLFSCVWSPQGNLKNHSMQGLEYIAILQESWFGNVSLSSSVIPRFL